MATAGGPDVDFAMRRDGTRCSIEAGVGRPRGLRPLRNSSLALVRYEIDAGDNDAGERPAAFARM